LITTVTPAIVEKFPVVLELSHSYIIRFIIFFKQPKKNLLLGRRLRLYLLEIPMRHRDYIYIFSKTSGNSKKAVPKIALFMFKYLSL